MSVSIQEKRQEGGFAESLRVIVRTLIIAVVMRTFLFQAFNIPSGSMEGTLLVGDYSPVTCKQVPRWCAGLHGCSLSAETAAMLAFQGRPATCP